MTGRICVVCFLGFCVGCATAPSVETGLVQEKQLGNFTDRTVGRSLVYVLDPQLDARVAGVGQKMVNVSERKGLDFTFMVVNDATVNAFAASGGYIYVNTGLLDALAAKDELAAILGHEITHVDNRDPLRSVYDAHNSRVTGTILGVALGAALAGVGAAALGGAAGYGYYSQQLIQQTVESGMRVGLEIGQAAAVSMVNGYSRQKELEADLGAVHYLHKAGYDPEALASVFKRFMVLRDQRGITKKNYVSNILNADPGLEERLKALEALKEEKTK